MGIRSFLQSILLLVLIGCKGEKNIEINGTIAAYGDQPYIAKDLDGTIGLVFGQDDNIYYSESNIGDSFSEPTIIGNLKGLMLGYSSGPNLVFSNDYLTVTAPDKKGDLYAWTKNKKETVWEGPYRINNIKGSVGESLSSITNTPDGTLFCTWIDTRFIERTSNVHQKTKDVKTDTDKKEDLNKMTPLGISQGELFSKIGNIPSNAKLAFHTDEAGKFYWVFLDDSGEAIKAENYEEYKKFRARNGNRVKIQGKIYVSSSKDGGKTWEPSSLVYQSPDGSVCECCKPSILSNSKGTLYLMFRNNINGSRDLHLTVSTDNGKTFSEPEKLGTGTWKIDGCPMDGGGITYNENSGFVSVWQREGEVFSSKNQFDENQIGYGRSPFISSHKNRIEVVYTSGENIIATRLNDSFSKTIGTGSFPKVIALENASLYIWMNEKGIHYNKTYIDNLN